MSTIDDTLTGKDDLDLYRQQYAGLTRGQLAKADPALYKRLQRAGQLEQVPTMADISDIRNQALRNQALLEIYQREYAGLTRGQLWREDSALYKRLQRAGQLEHVPTRDLGDALQHYHDQYAGLTRGQLQKTDPALYQRLRKSGQLEHVPTKKKKEK